MKRLMQMFALVLAFGISASVLAMGLDEAKQKLDSVKQQGLVGETPTGYLDVVRAEGQAREVVEAINSARRDEYKRIAEKHNIPVTQVETVAGKKAIEKTPTGQYVQMGGKWVKK
ncbi:YdbL family protein [uncultured Marinobacter sp.]|uniref:YdbL family protein n=1 Tax=uncultured Marinobacter sp. TaxID=187379 RepID=UPI0025FA1D5D|nr:YdbL family protein [uncultured Marinobacter sp.]